MAHALPLPHFRRADPVDWASGISLYQHYCTSDGYIRSVQGDYLVIGGAQGFHQAKKAFSRNYIVWIVFIMLNPPRRVMR